MMKAEERIMVSQRKVAVEWIESFRYLGIPKKFLFPFLEKKKKSSAQSCALLEAK